MPHEMPHVFLKAPVYGVFLVPAVGLEPLLTEYYKTLKHGLFRFKPA